LESDITNAASSPLYSQSDDDCGSHHVPIVLAYQGWTYGSSEAGGSQAGKIDLLIHDRLEFDGITQACDGSVFVSQTQLDLLSPSWFSRIPDFAHFGQIND